VKVSVDAGAGIGCGLCARACPEVFKMEADRKVSYKDSVTGVLKNAVKDVALQRPLNAIELEE